MRPYPLLMDLEDKQVVVVGGGRVALRKVKSLIASGAKVVVISPELEQELTDLSDSGKIHWVPEVFDEEHLDRYSGAALVFGTTDHRPVNVRIHAAAVERRIPCNIADVPDLCTFIVPAVVNRGDLTIAVSTGGASPALARRIREDLEQRFDESYERMTGIMGAIRQQILQLGMPSDENKALFMRLVDSDLLDMLSKGDRNGALRILREIVPNDVDVETALNSAMRDEWA